MATDNPSPPEGFDVAPTEPQDDVPTVELEPGDVLLGTVTDLHQGEGEYGPYVLVSITDEQRGLCKTFAKGELKRLYFDDQLSVGDEVWVHMTEETETFDGNEYHPVQARVKSD